MIKKIAIRHLQIGMYLHDLNAPWMAHGFLRSRFLLETAADLERIRQIGIGEVTIDTDKGADAAPDPEPAPAAPPPEPPAASRRAPTATGDEQTPAQRAHREAIGVLTGLMAEVKAGQQVDLERANPAVEGLVDSIFRNPNALLALTRIRHTDRYTFEHSVNVSVLMIAFAHTLDLEPALIHDLGVGALLHDLGKILIPNEILNKPGPLTDEEFAVMRGHVVHTSTILSRVPSIPPAALMVAANHHERFDGTGYPSGKSGTAISRYGQMAAVVDAYDAITSNRVYHQGLNPHAALRRLMSGSNQHFDPEVVQQFVRCLGIYPVGTLVRLRSERLGVVVETSREGLSQPVVRVFMDLKRRRHLTMQDVDLSRQRKGSLEGIERVEAPERWGVKPEDVLRMRCWAE